MSYKATLKKLQQTFLISNGYNNAEVMRDTSLLLLPKIGKDQGQMIGNMNIVDRLMYATAVSNGQVDSTLSGTRFNKAIYDNYPVKKGNLPNLSTQIKELRGDYNWANVTTAQPITKDLTSLVKRNVVKYKVKPTLVH